MAREGRERLGDRLLVADVREDVAPDGQTATGLRRDVEPGLMHQAQQAQGPQGHGLAARVRAGDDQRGVAVADPDVDRHDAAGQTGVARRQEHDLRSLGGLGPGRVHLGRQRRLGRPQVELARASSVSRSAVAFTAMSAESSSRTRRSPPPPPPALRAMHCRARPRPAARRTGSGRFRTRRGRCPSRGSAPQP